MCSKFTYVVAYCRVSLFKLNDIPLRVYATYSFSVHVLVDVGGCFHILALTDNAINMRVLISLENPDFSSFASGLLGHTTVLFLIWRKLHTVFHCDCTNLHFHKQYAVLISPHLNQHLSFFSSFLKFVFKISLNI